MGCSPMSINKTIRTTLTAAAASLMLGGCSGIVVYDPPGPQTAFFDGDFEYATHKGAIVTEVRGNPFAMPRDRFRDAVLGHMKGANKGIPADFVAAASARTILPYKVVAAFNVDPATSADELCGGTAQTAAASAAGARLDMVFCFGDDVKTEVAGTATGVKSTNDPRFRELVRLVTLALIPAQDAEDAGDNGGPVN